ncbi:MAG: methylated-DNA--[protein]-cysteine S-methyltransferase, partial [Muribaculaceae bacterium]|nr:methylated-DNA--[protein]-cysteine S-methyltransferase [Muribaculaceae bacterium]
MEGILYISEYQSSIGVLTLAATDSRLVLCAGKEVVEKRRLVKEVAVELGAADFYEGDNSVMCAAKQWLDNYFAGIGNEKEPPLLLCGSPFQNKVWLKLTEIPYGATVSYSGIAKDTGNPSAIRATANTIGSNRLWIFIPCHRVIGANGRLTGYAGGLEAKKFLLDLEAKNRLKLK